MTRLADLLLRVPYNEDGEVVWENHRPASVADLVAALLEQGGEKHEAEAELESDPSAGFYLDLPNLEPGSYLVFRIPEDLTVDSNSGATSVGDHDFTIDFQGREHLR